jgi:RND family efflux transporter MFP subunit
MLWRNIISPAVIGLLSLGLLACDDKIQSDPRTNIPLVRAVHIQTAEPASRTFTGTVAARVESDLGFRVAGKVLERLVDTGQTVKRGQLLMRIDPVDLKLAADAQQEAVAAAQARAQQALDDEVRYRDLLETGAVSASAYDQIKAAADSAKAQLSAAKAQADVANNAIRYAELVADGEGVVMDTLAEPGQVVNAGQVVVRLAHAGQREALIQLPETLRPEIGSFGHATRFGQDDTSVLATLRQLSETADPQTRTFAARYVLTGGLANAPLGTTVTVQIPDEYTAADKTLLIPNAALFDAGKGAGVWIISGQPSRVSWQPVVVQRIYDDSTYVTGNLTAGQLIVALGAHLLHENEQVTVADTTALGARP